MIMTLEELMQSQPVQEPSQQAEEKIGIYINTTDYSALGLSAMSFRILVSHLADHAVNLAKSLGAEAIAVRGTSGYSVAFAMRMLTSFPIIVARKDGESSHGCPISLVDIGLGRKINRYLILDDLVVTGTTVQRMVLDLKPALCVGVLEYIGLMNAILENRPVQGPPTIRGRMVKDISRYAYAF